jgi:hypothetical protein
MAKKCKGGGGQVGTVAGDKERDVVPEVDYGNKNVIREAEEKKKGGRAHKFGGKVSPPRLDKRRRTGGRVGSDSAPLSSAHKPTKVV